MSDAGHALAPIPINRAELAWWQALSTDSAAQAFFSAWLAIQAGQLPGLRHGALVIGHPDTGPFETVARYPEDSTPGADFYDTLNESLQDGDVAVSTRDRILVIAYPLVISGRIHGAAAFELVAQPPEALIQKVRWGMGVLEARLLRDGGQAEALTVERLMTVVNSVAKSLKEGSFKDVALTLSTDLAVRLECDRVSIGLRRDRRSRVVALSHSSKFVQTMNLMHTVAEAMDEAIDQNTTLCLPQDAQRTIQLRAHQRLARDFGNANILTVPFAPDEHARGALDFERPDTLPFDAQSIELCQSVVLLVGRILYQKQQQDRPFWLRWRDAVVRECGRLAGPRYIGRKLAVLAVAALAVFGYVAHGAWRVTADATVQGVVQRALAAPFDGYISESLHRAGDVVRKGETLAMLDTRETELELLRAGNLEVQYRRQAEEAMAQGNSAAAAIARAQARQAAAQIEFYRGQVERSAVKAPFDGILVSGDLSQQLGEAVKRGQELFKISPMDRYRLWLDVDDRRIDDVRVGQTGEVALASMPDHAIPFTVLRVVPLAQVEEGKSIFRVEARLEGDASAQLRPGMEGIGKIDAGERRYVWIWTRPFVEWFRLKWWSWFG